MKMKRLVATSVLLTSAFSVSAQTMEISRSGDRDTMIGPEKNFTGTSIVTPLFGAKEASPITGGDVTFAPGARSNWHTHPAGQFLVVTKGSGYVQQWGEPKQAIHAGDVVWTPPGVKHWHGATSTTALTHIAIQQKEGGKNVVWEEAVTDEQYND